MIDYHTFMEIKYLHDEKKFTPNKIGRLLGIDQKTASRWVKRDRFVKKSVSKRSSVIEPYKERIDTLISECSLYSSQQIFQILKDEGYKGSYRTVACYAGKNRKPAKQAYFTLNFEPGESAQVDFADCGIIQLGNTRRKFYAFIMTLCYSRMMYAEFIFCQNQEHFLQCHRNAFEYFRGIPKNIMVDNCKVAVLRNNGVGAVKLNPRYLDFSYHYNFNIKPCGVRKPNEKGQVEKAVDYLKRNFLRGKNDITGIDALNNSCRSWLDTVANVRIHKTTQKRPVDLLVEEENALGDVNILPYDCGTVKTVRANSQFRVVFEANRYSVPAEFASVIITLKIYPDRLLFYYENNIIAEHRRCYERNRDFEKPEHIKKLIEYKKNARDQKLLRSFFLISSKSEEYYAGLKEKKFNSKDHVRKILVLADSYGKEKTAAAIEDAMELGAFSSEYISNLLEQRERFTPTASPIHLLRNSDCLDLEIESPKMDIYSSFEKGAAHGR